MMKLMNAQSFVFYSALAIMFVRNAFTVYIAQSILLQHIYCIYFSDLYPIATVPLATNDRRPHGLPTVAWNPWNDLRYREDIAALNVSFPYGPLPDFYARLIVIFFLMHIRMESTFKMKNFIERKNVTFFV